MGGGRGPGRAGRRDDPHLAGEFALQAGDIDSAARWYLQAARSASGDAGLAERATRIALLANDNRIAAGCFELWCARRGRTPAVRGVEATLSPAPAC